MEEMLAQQEDVLVQDTQDNEVAKGLVIAVATFVVVLTVAGVVEFVKRRKVKKAAAKLDSEIAEVIK